MLLLRSKDNTNELYTLRLISSKLSVVFILFLYKDILKSIF